jgi:hypothetical protein
VGDNRQEITTMPNFSLSDVLDNHFNAVGYVKAVVEALEEAAQNGPPVGLEIPAEVAQGVHDEMRKMIRALGACAELLQHPGVVATVLAKASGELVAQRTSGDEAQVYHLTTTKRAQA